MGLGEAPGFERGLGKAFAQWLVEACDGVVCRLPTKGAGFGTKWDCCIDRTTGDHGVRVKAECSSGDRGHLLRNLVKEW